MRATPLLFYIDTLSLADLLVTAADAMISLLPLPPIRC